VTEVTLPVWVGLLTHAPVQVAGVAAAELVAGLAVGPAAGVLADRWLPRRTMLACDLLRLLLVLSLVVARGPATLPWIYGVGFLVAGVSRFFSPAKSVLLTTIVAPAAIPHAQALTQATQSLALIIGPALGATLLLVAGPQVGVSIDAVTFGVSALALLLVRASAPTRSSPVTRRAVRAAVQRLSQDLANGLVLTMRHRGLRTLLVVSVVMSLVGYLWFAVDLFFVQRSLHVPSNRVGFLWTAAGVGGLIGSAGVALAGGRVPQRRVLVCGLGLRGAALLWYATTTQYTLAVPAACAAGLGDALVLVALGSLTLRWTPQAAVGRTTALIESVGQLGA